MLTFSIGQKYPLYRDLSPREDGAKLEVTKEGFMHLTLFINRIMDDELQSIKKGKIEFRVYEDKEKGYVLTLIRIGGKKVEFEIVFDPSLYKKFNDERSNIELYSRSNMLQIDAVDGVILKAMRVIAIPEKLQQIWMQSWRKMLNPLHRNGDYMKWLHGLYRFSLPQLWEYSCPAGKIERQENILEDEK